MKISLTRLLNEIKLTNKKIDKKLSEDVKYFDIMAGGKLKNYKSEADMKVAVESQLQSIQDLIKQRDLYKKTLLDANNKTTLTVGDETFTIAEAIAKKDTVSQELSLIKTMKRQLNEVENNIQYIEADNDEKLDDLIRASIGKDKKTDAGEIESITKVFRDNNKVSLVDAGGAKKFLADKEEALDVFISNIDFSLSEINAKTEVEV
jgi:hypothetical protein